VQEGDQISQWQAIGEVGATGNVTGPHLHFEIRKENRVVNPELIIAFE
jgi:murein DD-endopeptidase MepM/ murein hydrolase activator NlpD